MRSAKLVRGKGWLTIHALGLDILLPACVELLEEVLKGADVGALCWFVAVLRIKRLLLLLFLLCKGMWEIPFSERRNFAGTTLQYPVCYRSWMRSDFKWNHSDLTHSHHQ